MEIAIGHRIIGDHYPIYFIADIAANHDGSLERAKQLILKARDAGADAAKFQNFQAEKIVSDYGFKNLERGLSHQERWEKPVFDVYKDASTPFKWIPILKEECNKAGIDYFSAPYDFDAVNALEPYVPAYKIGSGDITWLEILAYIAKQGKPLFLATGASTICDVQRAIHTILPINKNVILMQCNTNYTGSKENFKSVHLNVLKTYKIMFPDLILGFSDHTPGHSAVLGAVALGAQVIEKHFTDDTNRKGPDHAFSMDPQAWAHMVSSTRELESALGSGDKTISDNEKETVIIQRRCLRAARDIQSGEVLTRLLIDVLRPATPGALLPHSLDDVVGKKASRPILKGVHLVHADILWE